MAFCKGRGERQAGDREGRPYGVLQEVPCGRTDASAPTKCLPIEIRRAGPVCPAGGAGKIRVGPSGKSAKRCQWQRKRAGFEEVPRLADTIVTGNRLARRWATAGPYESVTRGAMGGRPRGSPLRKRYKRCNERATASVAPTEPLQEAQWAGDRKGRPYGGVTRSAMR